MKQKGMLKNGDDIVIAGGASVVPEQNQEETINRIIGGVLKI